MQQLLKDPSKDPFLADSKLCLNEYNPCTEKDLDYELQAMLFLNDDSMNSNLDPAIARENFVSSKYDSNGEFIEEVGGTDKFSIFDDEKANQKVEKDIHNIPSAKNDGSYELIVSPDNYDADNQRKTYTLRDLSSIISHSENSTNYHECVLIVPENMRDQEITCNYFRRSTSEIVVKIRPKHDFTNMGYLNGGIEDQVINRDFSEPDQNTPQSNVDGNATSSSMLKSSEDVNEQLVDDRDAKTGSNINENFHDINELIDQLMNAFPGNQISSNMVPFGSSDGLVLQSQKDLQLEVDNCDANTGKSIENQLLHTNPFQENKMSSYAIQCVSSSAHVQQAQADLLMEEMCKKLDALEFMKKYTPHTKVPNIAKTLHENYFTYEERVDRNCCGGHGKLPFDVDKMKILTEYIKVLFDYNDEKEIRRAINENGRRHTKVAKKRKIMENVSP